MHPSRLRGQAARAKASLGCDRVVALVETRLNLASLRFEVCGIRFVTPQDAAAASLEHVFRANQEDSTQAQVLAERFIDANHLRSGSATAASASSSAAVSGLSPLALAHEAYNTAYALKILASNMRLKGVAVVELSAAALSSEEDDDDSNDGDGDSDDEASRRRRRRRRRSSSSGGKPERHSLPLSDDADVATVVRALCKQASRRRR